MSSHKRKRSISNHLPDDTINPLSHSEGTIKQLRAAGLTADDLLPSNYIPDFPHRPIRPSHHQQQDGESDNDDRGGDDDGGSVSGGSSTSSEGGGAQHRARKARQRQVFRDAQDSQLGLLTNVILRALEEGDIPRAKRAFGLVRRSEVRGRPVDLRKRALWSLGAEILMRDGEVRSRSVVPSVADPIGPEGEGEGEEEGAGAAGDRARGTGTGTGTGQRRWGSTANMPRLREYLESLVRQYPYNRLHPDSVSDLDFHPVLFSCEFYDAWAEHRLALERLAEEAESWSEGELDDAVLPDVDMQGYYGGGGGDDGDGGGDGARAGGGHAYRGDNLTGRERRLRQAKADLGLRALSAMRDVAARMDGLMENAPYSRSAELLRLRGMVALYIGDLGVPPAPRTADEEGEAARVRGLEQERARAFFVRMVENGGRADACVKRWLRDGNGSEDDYGADDDDDDDYQGSQWGALPVFSSMPVR
ncbi:hypothetical protein KVR01_003923 [Diaporthe batatas]|uniref:uncharacterized protein n=1 Tax=Diaporthe batatas TaxID=748121 RepID=UPI001D04D910|nr:uncharacterized protein KVR01_003923 [Diaporthe batatas]KAG8168234.1 hypothetical protein KVR01_003923 [Diaporthe batatas]